MRGWLAVTQSPGNTASHWLLHSTLVFMTSNTISNAGILPLSSRSFSLSRFFFFFFFCWGKSFFKQLIDQRFHEMKWKQCLTFDLNVCNYSYTHGIHAARTKLTFCHIQHWPHVFMESPCQTESLHTPWQQVIQITQKHAKMRLFLWKNVSHVRQTRE